MKTILGFTVKEWITIVILFAIVIKVAIYVVAHGKA
ncbi:hypothetical protein EV143_11829 [Flavobacterium chryseum]|nr:hypothetical protein EV143_11829 [Flavobacterium sp. P3160]